MSVNIKPTSEIKARLGLEPNGRIQKFFTNTCYKAMDEFVPKDLGNLRTIVDIQSDSITYQSPYARYQYYGKKMVMPENGKSAFYNDDYGFWSKKGEKKILTEEDLVYHTPGTGSYWDKRMVSAKMDKVIEIVQNEINRGGK